MKSASIIKPAALALLVVSLSGCVTTGRYIIPGPSAEADNPPITVRGKPRSLVTRNTNATCYGAPPPATRDRIVAFNNQVRAGQGVSELRANNRLDQAAAAQACDIARLGRLTHVGIDGTGVSQRLNREGYLSCFASENIAIQYRTADEVNDAWLESPGHRKNMLRSGIKDIGVGYADSANGPVWVTVFAKKC